MVDPRQISNSPRGPGTAARPLRELLALTFALVLMSGAAFGQQKKHVLLLGQSPDGRHKTGTHEYMPGMRVLAACLKNDSRLHVTLEKADSPWTGGPDKMRQADCVVMYVAEGAKWIHEGPRRLEAFASHAAKGGGFVTVHWAMGAKDAKYIDGYLKLFGGCHGGDDRQYKSLQTRLEVVSPNEPITKSISSFEIEEELYYRLKFTPAKQGLRSILKTQIDGRDETVAWAWQRPDQGRSFGYSGCHYHLNWKRQEYRRMMTQAVLWTLKLDPPAAGVNIDVDEKVYAFPE